MQRLDREFHSGRFAGGEQGRDAIDFYTEKKIVVERWPSTWSRKF